MRGLFIYYKKIDKNKLTGIDKKVLWQVEEFNKDGITCELISNCYDGKSKIRKLANLILARIPCGNANPRWKWDEKYKGIDYIYFRRPDAITKPLLKFLRKIKEENQNIKVVMEIPNFPYDQELGLSLINKPLLIKDRFNRMKLRKYVDKIAVQNNIDKIYGIQTLCFTNGIKIDEIKIRRPENYSYDEKINICAVASLEPWQGYERIIRGLSDYYNNGGKREININIAGSGSELEFYKNMVKENNLSERIKFWGRLSKDKLEKVYNESDLALDAFGRYKTGNILSTSLKSREYLAKGLPIITGCKTDILTDNFKYYIEFPNDSSNISFETIVSFYDELYKNKNKRELIKEIREYAKSKCDISKMVKPVKDYLLDV